MNEIEERWRESNPELVAVIRDEILESGAIRFDRFMDLALYHDPHGYYLTKRARPGRAGDFLTAPEAHPIFGATLAAQIVDFDALLEHPNPFTVIEYGAGSGLLIRPLLAELRQQDSTFYDRIKYVPVEINESRLTELSDHLKEGDNSNVLTTEMPVQPVCGCVIANEFIDALPARRITWREGEVREARITWREGWFAEELASVDDPEVLEYLSRHDFTIREGEWLEFHPGIGAWLQEIGRQLQRGFVLIVDYGYGSRELFSGHRRKGTLKAYYQHGVSEEFYRGIGEQDLTAHVNFSEIKHQASRHGFRPIGMTTQADLLGNLGIGERLVRMQGHAGVSADDYLATRAAVMRMIDPGAMGRFRALFLGRDVPDVASPVGLGST